MKERSVLWNFFTVHFPDRLRAFRSFSPSEEKETPRLLLPNLTRTTFLSTIFFKPLVNSTHSFSTRDQFKACVRDVNCPCTRGMIFVNIPCPRGEIVVKSPSITPTCTGGGGVGGVIDKCIRPSFLTEVFGKGSGCGDYILLCLYFTENGNSNCATVPATI